MKKRCILEVTGNRIDQQDRNREVVETMNKKKKYLVRMLLLLVMLLTAAPASASAKIKINKSKLTLAVGKSYRMKLSGLSGDEEPLVWKSTRTSIAKISKAGKVTAKKKGVSYLYTDVNGKRYRCRLTVTQPVTKIKLNKTKKSVTRGKSFTLKATVSPKNANKPALSWKSSDPSVATVDQTGRVSAVGKGTAKITATAKDGSRVKAACKVTVSLEDIRLSAAELKVEVGKSMKLSVYPSGDGSQYQWKNYDPSVASVTNGTVRGLKAGTTWIAAVREEDLQSVTCKVKVTPAANTGGVAPMAQEFLALMEQYSQKMQEHRANGIPWIYPKVNNYAPVCKTWKGTLQTAEEYGVVVASCVQMSQWGLRHLGIIGKGNFRGDIGGGFTIKDRVQLDQYCEVIRVDKTPNQLLAEGNLLPGDICSYVRMQHTNVYAGDGMWYDSGRMGCNGYYRDDNSDVFEFTTLGPVPAINMDSEVIGTIVRIVK